MTIQALRDTHLVSTSQPVAYDTRGLENVQYARGGIAYTLSPISRGDGYWVYGYIPRPTPAQLAKSPPDYPSDVSIDRRDLGVGRGDAAPPFGDVLHDAWANAYVRSNGDGRSYRPRLPLSGSQA